MQPTNLDTATPPLDCPSCGYNVGPTSDWTPGRRSTCPECGESFIADHLYRLTQQAKPKPVTVLQVLLHLFLPPVAVCVIAILAAFFLPQTFMPLGFVLLLAMFALNIRLAYRITSRNTPPYSAWQILRLLAITLLLWLAQAGLIVFAVFGGCVIMLRDLNGL